MPSREMKWERLTSIGRVSGLVGTAFFIGQSDTHEVWGSWSTAEDIKGMLNYLGLRTDESPGVAADIVNEWRAHEEKRKRKSWRHERRRSGKERSDGR
jgi:hypothetical protein